MTKPVIIVQGAQFGSEAKGAIAAHICETEGVDICVRTGATNAGHTAYFEGVEVKLQQLPVGFVNPSTKLILGAGTLIDPVILEREVALLSKLTRTDIRSRLMIDRRCGLHMMGHALKSEASGRHHLMGATGKGCSEALIDRIRLRGSNYVQFGDSSFSKNYDVGDTEAFLNFSLNEGASVMLEGTQGQLLDLYLGPYPYVTHKQTGPAQWLLEAGLSPALPTRIISVVRTYPIRVAGNSGPLDREMSWPELARIINSKRKLADLPSIVRGASIEAFEDSVRALAVDFDLPQGSDGLDQHTWSEGLRFEFREALSELNAGALSLLDPPTIADLRRLFELTTVTKKLRRVAALSNNDLAVSSRQMRPHELAVTFMNYVFPEAWYEKPEVLGTEMIAYLNHISAVCRAPVSYASFGPESGHISRVPFA